MHLVENALQIALEAHAGQTDKAGAPYVLHPIRLMLRMKSETMQAAAVLHDVLEDSSFTRSDLRNREIPKEVIGLVDCLTKQDDEDTGDDEGYERFINRIAGNPTAARIKMADIEDNLDVLRISELRRKDLDRIRRYHRAWQVLDAAVSRAEAAPA